jgi:putative ABC transport system permease protein
MGVAMLIGLWIWDEVSYNKNFDNYDRIVRVMETTNHGGEIATGQAVPLPLGNELRTLYGSDFQRVALGSGISKHTLGYDGDKQIIGNGIYIQRDFLPMFSVRLLKGSMASLNDPYSTVISASLAQVMYGDADPLGKLVKIDNKSTLKISGVYLDFPHNCELYNTQLLMAWGGLGS